MAKYTLNNEEDLDFAAISISCPDDLYATLNAVDAALGIELLLIEHAPFTLKANKVFKFSLYQHVDEDLGLEYFFIPNLSDFEVSNEMRAGQDLFSEEKVEERTRLIKELPRTDYFLTLKGEALEHTSLLITELLRQCPTFTQVNPIAVQDLPSRRNLIF